MELSTTNPIDFDEIEYGDQEPLTVLAAIGAFSSTLEGISEDYQYRLNSPLCFEYLLGR